MMPCPPLPTGEDASLASALAALDCHTGQATAFAFGRLFGSGGRLLPALTILLTLYIGFFAISLLTGRSRLGLSALTPRMMTLGLVLTFATSWEAYQGTIWTLASGAPDQIAGVVLDQRGSATLAFAQRLDALFADVSDAADAAATPAPATDQGITPAAPTVAGFSASTVLWLSAIMLLLGTVGVLVTAKIALAALLALGPVFIVLALFSGTRGLFEGWLKSVALFALVPLFTVLIGGAALEVLAPVAGDLALAGGQPSSHAAAVLFVGASVYLALLLMVLKVSALLVGQWRLPGRAAEPSTRDAGTAAPSPPVDLRAAHAALPGAGSPATAGAGVRNERIRGMLAALPAQPGGETFAGPVSGRVREIVAPAAGSAPSPLSARDQADPRIKSVGSRFRSAPAALPRGAVR